MRLQTIACFNATDKTTGERVGIFVEHNASIEHPDKEDFTCLDYCPVWAYEVYTVWKLWQHFRHDKPLQLRPFIPLLEAEHVSIKLDVMAFVRQGYDPFAMSKWIWGMGVLRDDVDRWVSAMHEREHWAEYRFGYPHDWRIAYLVEYPVEDPVQVVEHCVGECRYIIGDGTHRFAAAVVRGEKEILAIATYRTAERLINEGLGRRP